MIVIGRGMLAKAFHASNIVREDLVLFCSGVSNSSETSADAFNREKSLFLEVAHSHPRKKIVYFSSCSADAIETPYYRHKLAMEALVSSETGRYLIARLPQVVGIAKNTTLVSHIVGCISRGTPVTCFEGARRNLIDVNDVVRLTLFLASLDIDHINISNGNMVLVEEIIWLVSGILGIEPVLLAGQVGAGNAVYDGEALKCLIDYQDLIYSANYNQSVLLKYVPILGISYPR